MNVFITHAEEDRESAEDLAKHLGLLGLVRLDDGTSGFLPFQRTDVVVALWSQKTQFSIRRLLLEKRIVGAWAENRLVLVQLDRHFLPVGLRDLPAIDASFVQGRSSGAWFKVQREVRETLNKLRKGLFEPEVTESLMGDDDEEMEILEEEGVAEPDSTVFVSYSHSDTDVVTKLVDIIKENGKAVWIDKAGITPGESWAGEIVRGIKSADGIFVMCSPRAFESDHIKREVYLADRYRKPMLPVFLEEAELPDDFEFFFAGVQHLFLYQMNENEYASVLSEALTNL